MLNFQQKSLPNFKGSRKKAVYYNYCLEEEQMQSKIISLENVLSERMKSNEQVVLSLSIEFLFLINKPGKYFLRVSGREPRRRRNRD